MSNVMLSDEPNGSNSCNNVRLRTLKTRLKKKKRRKDLEQLHRNVLSAKRKLIRQRSKPMHRSISKNQYTNSLKKTLNMLAEVRQDNDNKLQGLMDKNSSEKLNGKTICARLLPEPSFGIFKNGAKSKDVRRKIPDNLPLYETNDARLCADVFKLLNNNDTATFNNVKNSVSLHQNEPSENKRDAHSILHHYYQQFNVAKDNSTFNNASSPQIIFNCVKRKQNEEYQKIISPNVLENNQQINNYVSSTNRYSWKANDDLLQMKLSQSAVRNNMQSIKRWGISPVLCYDELCSKINAENFSLSFTKLNMSDPIIQIKTALKSMYAETHEQCTNSNINNNVSSTNYITVTPKIGFSSQSSPIIHRSATNLSELSSSNSSLPVSHPIAESNLKCSNKCSQYIEKQSDIRNNAVINYNKINQLPNKLAIRKKKSQCTEHHTENSPKFNYIIDSSVSASQNPVINSTSGVSVDINSAELCKINHLKRIEAIKKKSRRLKNSKDHVSDEKMKFYFTPTIIKKISNNNKVNDIYEKCEMAGIREFLMPNNEFIAELNSNNCNEFHRRNIIKHQVNNKINRRADMHNNNFHQMPPNSSTWDVNPQLSENITHDITQSSYQPDSDSNYGEPNYSDVYTSNIKSHEYLTKLNKKIHLPQPISLSYDDVISTTTGDSQSLANENCVKSYNQEIMSMNESQNSYLPFWNATNFTHNMKNAMIFTPLNHNDKLRRCVKHNSETNIELNSASVLHNFKGLSFQDNKINRSNSLVDYSRCFHDERRSVSSYSNLHQPSKYYAISNENNNDHVPQRIPLYLNTEKLQPINSVINDKSLNSKITCCDNCETLLNNNRIGLCIFKNRHKNNHLINYRLNHDNINESTSQHNSMCYQNDNYYLR